MNWKYTVGSLCEKRKEAIAGVRSENNSISSENVES
jgi:hypothetical protein